jgi:hypothetical protein
MGVCTSKRIDFAERILTSFGLRAHFAFVSGPWELEDLAGE